MPWLLIGTDTGIYRLNPDTDEMQAEGGPASVAMLAKTQTGVAAITPAGELWEWDEALGWHAVHPRPVPDDVWALAADPRLAGRRYLGVSPALLYRSDDGGSTWAACESVRRIPGYERWTFPPPPHIPHVRSIAPDPDAAGAVYIGVEEGGVYRSPDGGETWESLNEGLYWDVHTVTPAPEGGRLYATTGGGFYRSDDSGHSWQRMGEGLDRGYTVPFAASSRRPGRVYAAAAAGPPPSWSRGADAALYRSDDGGGHWARLTHGLPEQFDRMVMAIVLDGGTGVYAASGQDVYASIDEGESWRRTASGVGVVRGLLVLDG